MKKTTLSVVKKTSAEPHFYIIVSKKISPLATKRNLLKRRLKQAAKNLLADKTNTKTVIIYPKKEALRRSYKELCSELQRAVRKL